MCLGTLPVWLRWKPRLSVLLNALEVRKGSSHNWWQAFSICLSAWTNDQPLVDIEWVSTIWTMRVGWFLPPGASISFGEMRSVCIGAWVPKSCHTLCGFSPVIHLSPHSMALLPTQVQRQLFSTLTYSRKTSHVQRKSGGGCQVGRWVVILPPSGGISRVWHTSNKADWPLPEKLLRTLAKRMLGIYQGFVLWVEGALGQYHTYAEQTLPVRLEDGVLPPWKCFLFYNKDAQN